MGQIVRFYSTVIWLGISLALMGQLKSCTLTMLGLAKCSHGSVSLEKRVYLLEKQANAQKKALADALAVQGLSAIESKAPSTNLIEYQTNKEVPS
jgi:hypothetical protein